MTTLPPPAAHFAAFRDLYRTAPVLVDILNTANPDALPAPLLVSRRETTNPHENKLVLGLVNQGSDRLVLGGPNRTGLYLNFSDLMDVKAVGDIAVTIEGTPVQAMVVYPMFTFSEVKQADLQHEWRDPRQAPPANNEHLGEEPVLYIWPEKELELRPQDSLLVSLENVTSDFRPALRYIDISWELLVRPYGEQEDDKPIFLNGFRQLTVKLERPADYTNPPLPLQMHWLNNSNLIYTTPAGAGKALANELTFCISNVGLDAFKLDCSKHSRGVPYFELVMPVTERTDTTDQDQNTEFSSVVADIHDLELAQVTEVTPHSSLNQLWRTNKRIQGTVVKWEIRPDLDFDFTSKTARRQAGKKVLLGVDQEATITFKLHNLISRLAEGVALVYFRYYNMPDHDDGQLVLFLEKRDPARGGTLLSQLDKEENKVATPLQWRIAAKETGGPLVTQLMLGETLTRRVIHNNLVHEVIRERLPLNVAIEGDTTIDGSLTVTNLGTRNDKLIREETRHASLKLIGVNKGSSMWRVAEITAGPDQGEANVDAPATSMTFQTRGTDAKMHQALVIDSQARLGIGVKQPQVKLDVKGDAIIDGTLKVTGNIELKNSETFIQPAKDKYVRLGSSSSAFQDLYCRFTYIGQQYAVSDAATKEEIHPLDRGMNARAIIRRLQPVSYRRRRDGGSGIGDSLDDMGVQYGFIANEVEKVVPEAVTTMRNSTIRALNYQTLNTILFQAVKDQQEQLEEMDRKVKDLEYRLSRLERF